MPPALVIAAGMGSRIAPLGSSKPLVPVCGEPLIGHVLRALRAAGVTRTVVVLGHRAQEVERYVTPLARTLGLTLETVFNPDYRAPNGWSALAGARHIAHPFLLSMSDHVFAPSIPRALVARPLAPGEARLAVDRRLDNPLVDLADVTRVRDDAGYILDIGKGLSDWTAFDTGLFYLGESFLSALEAAAAAGEEVSLSAAMHRLAADRLARTVDIGDAFWIDVDDAAARDKVERHFAHADQPAI